MSKPMTKRTLVKKNMQKNMLKPKATAPSSLIRTAGMSVYKDKTDTETLLTLT